MGGGKHNLKYLTVLSTQLGGNDRCCVMTGETVFISAVSGDFQDMLCPSTPHLSVCGYSVCLGSGRSAIVLGMVRVSYPPVCT